MNVKFEVGEDTYLYKDVPEEIASKMESFVNRYNEALNLENREMELHALSKEFGKYLEEIESYVFVPIGSEEIQGPCLTIVFKCDSIIVLVVN